MMRTSMLQPFLMLCFLFVYCEGCMEEERVALLLIEDSINSPEGTAFSSWYGENCCEWEGVVCDVPTSRVIKMSFQYRRDDFTKTWFPNATVFAQFKDLQELYLSGNNVEGFISPNELDKLKHLQRLDLRSNSIADASHLCWRNMSSLNFLDLSVNKLQGHIPKCLCKTRSFTNLILSSNQLNGSIHACFGDLTSLKHLYLSDNEFSGKFPSSLFSNLTNIQTFRISGNQFTDKISFSIFANLSKLSDLDISYNPDLEVETESPAWHPSFNLNQLKLSSCSSLNKQSGKNIPSFISTQSHLQSLDLSHNSLAGRIPSWLFYNVSSELLLRGNNLSDILPKFQKNISSQLAILDISDNLLHGPLPEDINPIFPKLRQLIASRNLFIGNLPKSFGEMKKLRILDLSSNSLHGQIPRETLTNMTQVETLDLSDNSFEGEILAKNSSLPNLRRLYLGQNNFSSMFLDSLSTCTSLTVLDIGDNDFSGELSSELPVLPAFRVILLHRNRFKGKIPLQLCQMPALSILDLSENYLSGRIPTCLDNITSFTDETFVPYPLVKRKHWAPVSITTRKYHFSFIQGIDISSNQLTGTIPLQVTRLTVIQVMNLSHNFFTGQIPASLVNMKMLEALDLSHNKLVGALPLGLTGLTFLSTFSVSFNNLSGQLPPIVNQFATFDESSYEGNPFLCGSPLENKCNQILEKSHTGRHDMASISTLIWWWCTFLLYIIWIVN